MAVLNAQTRAQLRESIGYNLGAMHVGSNTSTGGTLFFVDSELPKSNNFARGKHYVGTSGNANGDIRIVEDYDGESKTGSFRTAASGAIASTDTYELWDEDMPPARIHDFINRAIRTITRKGAPPLRDITVHASPEVYRYDLASNVAGVRQVYARRYEDYELIHQCDGVWDTIDGDVTASVDYEDHREGSGSLKLVATASVGAGDVLASTSISTTADIRGKTHLEFWMKSTVTTASGDLTLSMSGTGYSEETFTVPILTADEWQFIRVPITRAEEGETVTTVNVNYVTDIGAVTVWVDGIRAVREDSGSWEVVHPKYWRIDKDARQLVFTSYGHPGYALLDIQGRQKPTLMSSDTDTCDIEPEYVIAKATAFALRARADRNSSSREGSQVEADRWEALAQAALNRQQTPSGVRWVSD